MGELGDKLNDICTASKNMWDACKIKVPLQKSLSHPVHHPERDCWPAILFGI